MRPTNSFALDVIYIDEINHDPNVLYQSWYHSQHYTVILGGLDELMAQGRRGSQIGAEKWFDKGLILVGSVRWSWGYYCQKNTMWIEGPKTLNSLK